jgi:hypothetical protein
MADTPPDRQRIAELEQEVAQLRQRLGHPAPGTEGAGEPAAAEPEDVVPFRRRATTPRLVVLGALIALVALGGMFAIFHALSTGFEAFSKEAANALVPDSEEADTPRPAPAPPPRPGPDEVPRVPGL